MGGGPPVPYVGHVGAPMTGTPETHADGFCVVVERGDGVFVSVWPPMNGGSRLRLADARAHVERYGVTGIDDAALARAVLEADGTEVRIADAPFRVAPPEETTDVDVEVSRERMRAYASWGESDDPDRRIAEVMAALKAAGVRYGIRRDEIRRLALAGRPVEGALVAEGEPAEDGEDARIVFAFDPAPRYRPLEREDGSVDHREVLLITSVAPGDILARVEPATPGRAGIRVDGRTLAQRPGVDRLRIEPGENVEEREGGRAYVATAAGHPVWDGRRLRVQPVYVVAGDVGGETGNVRFEGGVLVRGWVRAGFVVEAGGDVEVLGGVEGGDVRSREGSVFVHGGVRGNGRVRAALDVGARFVEGSEVFACRDVVVGDAALHAEISAGRRVSVVEGRGLVLGGVVRAQESIRARTLGAWSETATETQVRIEHVRTKELLAEIVGLEDRIRAAEADSRRLRSILEAYPSDLPGAVRPRLARALEVLEANREAFLQEKQRRERILGSVRGGEVTALQRIHPGVVIAIGHRTFTIEHRIAGCTFYRDGNEIRWT